MWNWTDASSAGHVLLPVNNGMELKLGQLAGEE
jgi:hypothetical protein